MPLGWSHTSDAGSEDTPPSASDADQHARRSDAPSTGDPSAPTERQLRLNELLSALARTSKVLATHLHHERAHAEKSLARAHRLARTLDLHEDTRPRPAPIVPAHEGIATLLELKQEMERGRNAAVGPSLSETVDGTQGSVASMQKSIQTLNDVLAKRRARQKAREVLVVQVTPQPEEEPEASEEALDTEQQSRREQLQEAKIKARTRGEPSIVRTRMMRLCAVLFVALVVSPLVARFAPISAYAVATDSMDPAIPKGTLVMARDRPADVDDVVVYQSAFGDLQIHRVVEVLDLNGTRAYTTRGDANEGVDSFTVFQDDVRGVVVRSTAHIGYFWLFPLVYKVAALVALVAAYIGITLWDRPQERSKVRRAVTAGLAAAVVLLPGAFASVAVSYPSSVGTVGVNDPTPLPLVAGDEGAAVITADQNSATATVGPMELWKEIVMWGCDPADDTAAGCVITPPTAYTAVEGSITRVRLSDYTPAPTFYLEAYLKASAGETVSVRLWDMNDGAAEPGTELSTTSTDLVLVRSAGFSLAGTRDYQFQTMTTGAAAAGEVRMVKVLSVQEDATETLTHVTLSGAGRTTDGGPWRPLARTALFMNEEDEFDGSTFDVWFEVVAEGVGSVRLRDVTDNRNAATRNFDNNEPTRSRTGDIAGAIRTDNVHQIEVDTDNGDTLDVYVARLIYYQRGFTKTLTYVDLTSKATTTETAFTEVGFDARYHGENEWGPPEGYFEATMLNTQGGATTSARLVDRNAGAAIAGSQVDVTSTSIARSRSGLIQLDDVAGDYAVEYKASAGTAEIRNAWLILRQGPTETFDHVLETQQVSGTCTWEFTLARVATTSIGRLESLTIKLASGASQEDQIVISNGVVTQAEGSPVTLVDGATDLRHILVVDTDAAGTSTIDADLKGTCVGTGIHTKQRISYVIE